MEIKERNIVSPFNVIKTSKFCSPHFHEGICVGMKSRKYVQYNEAFAHLYSRHPYQTIHNGEKFSEY